MQGYVSKQPRNRLTKPCRKRLISNSVKMVLYMILVGSLRCIIPQVAKLRIKSEILAEFHIKVWKEHFKVPKICAMALVLLLQE